MIKVNPQFEFILHNLKLTSSDWENLLFEMPIIRKSHSNINLKGETSSDVESLLVELRRAKEERKLNR